MRRVDDSGQAQLLTLLQSHSDFHRRVMGERPSMADARSILVDLPPGIESARKHTIGLWEGQELVAFADVIRGWPSAEFAHIGLLMSHGSRRGQGLGRLMHEQVESLVGGWSEVSTLRLSIVDTNAHVAASFWSRLAYRATGD